MAYWSIVYRLAVYWLISLLVNGLLADSLLASDLPV
jgi:hypothetical protein